MRFYDLKIADPNSGQVWKPTATTDGFAKSAGGTTFTSWVNNQNVPGALDVEFDLPVVPFNTPQGAAMIRVWGVGINHISQAANLNGQNLTLTGGMKKGLPLANPKQAGLLLQSTIYQAFGNWQGTNMSLDLICYPRAAQQGQDISFYWPAGMSLATALTTCFTQAFSKYSMTPKVSIANITLPGDGSGHYDSLAQLAQYVQEISQKVGARSYGDDYSGVMITITGNTIYAWDSKTPRQPIAVLFTDLIGQPTWIDPATINVKNVLRSDIAVGGQITLPQKAVTAPYVLTAQAAAVPNPPSRSKSIFQGTFLVTEVHHFARFRQADADSWATTFNAVPVPTLGAA